MGMPRPTPKSPKLLRRAEFGSMAEYLEHVDRFTEYQEMKEAMDKVKRSLTTKYNAEAETVEDKMEEKAEHVDEDEEEGEVKHSTKIRQLQTKSNPEAPKESRKMPKWFYPQEPLRRSRRDTRHARGASGCSSPSMGWTRTSYSSSRTTGMIQGRPPGPGLQGSMWSTGPATSWGHSSRARGSGTQRTASPYPQRTTSGTRPVHRHPGRGGEAMRGKPVDGGRKMGRLKKLFHWRKHWGRL